MSFRWLNHYLRSKVLYHVITFEAKRDRIIIRRERCRKIIEMIEKDELSCAISCLVLDEVAWVVSRHIDFNTGIKIWSDILEIPNERLITSSDKFIPGGWNANLKNDWTKRPGGDPKRYERLSRA